jgi:hypothetical protein
MNAKEKIILEYPLKSTSLDVIWNAISTPSGLEYWFAEKVVDNGKNITFIWGKTDQRDAVVTAFRQGVFIRFRWLDVDDKKEYMEFRLNYNELTDEYELIVTDFVEPEEKEDMKSLWNSQVETLRRGNGL